MITIKSYTYYFCMCNFIHLFENIFNVSIPGILLCESNFLFFPIRTMINKKFPKNKKYNKSKVKISKVFSVSGYQ